MKEHNYLNQLWERGRKFLQTEFAIMGGAMTWVSEHQLVSTISERGGFGVIACGAMSPQQLANEIQETRNLTSKPFGVNLICFHPQLNLLLDVCGDLKVDYIVFAGGIPSSTVMNHVKSFGCKVICFVSTVSLAKRLIRIGTDALIIEGMEAGGHIGPVSTLVLVQEILPVIREVPIFVAGGIGRGESMVSYLLQGAAGIQMGTRFVCAEECIAHKNFKAAFVRAAARDAVPSVQLDARFPVIPVRALVNQGTKNFLIHQRKVIDSFESGNLTSTQAQLEIEHFWAGALRRAVIEGDVENGSLMAGQSVGMVDKEQTVQEILSTFLTQAHRAVDVTKILLS